MPGKKGNKEVMFPSSSLDNRISSQQELLKNYNDYTIPISFKIRVTFMFPSSSLDNRIRRCGKNNALISFKDDDSLIYKR